MKLHLNGRDYPVLIVKSPLMRDGLDRDSWFDSRAKQILIADKVPVSDRFRLMVHEAIHAWQEQRGLPADEESEALDSSTFFDLIDQQVDAQGGRKALEQLRADDMNLGAGRPVGMVYDRMTCPRCETEYMIGSIESDEPKMHPEIGQHFITRWLDCPRCCLMTWQEICTPSGQPLGQYLANPKTLTGAEVVKFKRERRTPLLS